VTYFGFPALLLYPAGFLVFSLQIWTFYPLDYSTAWYATSLIPVPVITGPGAKILLGPLIISSFISLSVSWWLAVKSGEELRNTFRSSNRGLRGCLEVGWRQLSILGKRLTLRASPILVASAIAFLAFIVPVSAAVLTI
jgi:hypothetical protein